MVPTEIEGKLPYFWKGIDCPAETRREVSRLGGKLISWMEGCSIDPYLALNVTLGWAAGVVPTFPGQLHQGPKSKLPSGLHQWVSFPWKAGELERTGCSVHRFQQDTRLMCGWSTQAQELGRAPGSPDCSREHSLPDSPNAGTDRMQNAFLFCL